MEIKIANPQIKQFIYSLFDIFIFKFNIYFLIHIRNFAVN
jgi:hypothetical protein